MCSKDKCKNIHRSTLYNKPTLETTEIFIGIMRKGDIHQRRNTVAINMNESHTYAKQNGTKEYMLQDAIFINFKNRQILQDLGSD